MAKIFAASRRKYQALDGFKDRTATVISSGLMIYKKEPFIRILMPHKNLGLWVFVCPPEGGACSSWIKHGFSHSLRQRLRGVTEKWFGRVG